MDFDEVFIQNSDKSISHLGLVAGAFDELNIGTIIDNLIPKTGNHNLSHGDIVKSMILNGLGFVERRLYLFQDFFTDIAIERLIKDDIQLEYLNDDVIGRSLDAIHKFGPTELFNNIVAHSLKTQEFAVHLVNADTTNVSVHGNYDSDSNTEEIKITHGYPKDGRWDLKRFVLGLATNQCGVPLFMKTFSGNESDKTALLSVIQDVKKNLQNTDKVYHVADSAFYTDENLKTLGTHTFWISRVPLTLNEAQILQRISQPFNVSDDPRYSFYESTSNYADIPQKWIVFHSSEQQKKKEATFTKKLTQTELTTRRLFKRLLAKTFACEADALATATKWIEKKPFYQFSYLGVKTVTVKEERKRGRPRNDESVAIKYKIDAHIEVDQDSIDYERSLLGRFIIATNDLELNSETALSYYKKQSNVESGFRFLKDPSFRVSEVYLKKISRIRALAMIMVLCLFVYAVTEYKLRQKLKEQNTTIIAQTKKQTQKPTLKWVFFLFSRVREITLKIDGKLVTRVLNIDSTLEKIIRLLGRQYENYYFS